MRGILKHFPHLNHHKVSFQEFGFCVRSVHGDREDCRTEYIVRKFCKDGQLGKALDFTDTCHEHGMAISRDTIYELLLLCVQKKDLAAARQVQYFMVRIGLDSVAALGNHIIRIFTSCQSLQEANKTFSMVSSPSVHTWSAIISAHAEHDRGNQAFKLYAKMQEAGISPDKVVFLGILKACKTTSDLDNGRLIHHQILEAGLDSDVAIGSTLIVAYANCDELEDARRVFDKVSNADQVIWGAMITGYASNNQGSTALDLFLRMQQEGIQANDVIYTCTLKACASTGEVRQGRQIHYLIIEAGMESNILVGSSLIDMYGKYGNLKDARQVFDTLQKRNIVSWGALIGAYVLYGYGSSALEIFTRMPKDCIKPDKLIYIYILRACETLGALKECRYIHDQIVRTGLNADALVSHTLIEVYLVCGSLIEGNKIFNLLSSHDTDSWNALISGYAASCHAVLAIELFDKLQQERVALNNVLFLSFLKACGNAGAIEQGRQVHGHVVRRGLETDGVIASSLIDMYAKGGSLVEARIVFDKVAHRDVVIWGAMISAYSTHGFCTCVCELYEKMHVKGIKPDKVIFLCLLKACGSKSLVVQGRIIHCQIIRANLDSDIDVGNTIVDMYAKCGSSGEAMNAFHHLPYRDEVSWAAVTSGCVRHGSGDQASWLLDGIIEHGLKPMGAFTNLLASCSHAGLLEDGIRYFRCMGDVGIAPDIEQYSCMVDLFCRKGGLNIAEDLLQTMPIVPDFVVWISLLTSCRTHGELERGKQCFDEVMVEDVSDLKLLWSLYQDTPKWRKEIILVSKSEYFGSVKIPC